MITGRERGTKLTLVLSCAFWFLATLIVLRIWTRPAGPLRFTETLYVSLLVAGSVGLFVGLLCSPVADYCLRHKDLRHAASILLPSLCVVGVAIGLIASTWGPGLLVLLGIAFMVTYHVACLLIRRFLPDIMDLPYPSCPECGYNLTGNESGVCPECGTEIEKP